MYDVYVINLDKRPDRYNKIIQNINTYSKILNVKRFSAINGEERNEKYATWIYCALSHLALIEMAKERNLDYIMVMEDDNQITSTLFDDKLMRLMKIPDWEVYNGNPTYLNRDVENIKCIFPCPIVISYKYGKTTNFMIYRKNSYDRLLILKQIYLDIIYNIYTCNKTQYLNYEIQAYDNLLCQFKIKFVTIYPYLTTQSTDYSDIAGQVVSYTHCIRDYGYNIIKSVIGDNYVACVIKGGLGNQIFALLTAFALALKNNCYLTCEAINIAKCPDRDVNEYWDTLFQFMDINNNMIKYTGYDEQINEGNNWGKYMDIKKTKNRLLIDGYFQNAEYFNKYYNELKIFLGFDIFLQINNKIKEINFNYKYDWLINNYNKYMIAIHVRRGDYVKLQHYHHLTPIEYYNKCFQEIQTKRSNLNILKPIKKVIFSDDIKWCKEQFNQNDETIFIEQELDYIELILFTYFDAYIIANSTFSWLGAYLSNTKNQLVFMPGKWFNAKNIIYPNGLQMPNWNKITY